MPKISTDVVVVGSGIAGAAAAIELGVAGVSFIGIDAGTAFGGTAIRAGAGVCIPMSPLQKDRGIEDSPELAMSDLLSGSTGVDETWARRYFENAPDQIYGWMQDIGVRFISISQNEGESVPRWHRPEGRGVAVMDKIWNRGLEYGFADAWKFGLRCEDLIRRGDAVAGLVASDAQGTRWTIEAHAVIMATGGFAGNRAMVSGVSALGGIERFLAAGGLGAQGEGHRLLARHGVQIVSMKNVLAYATGMPDYRDPTGRRGVIVRGVKDWIWLNAEGRRFHDEENSVAGRSAIRNLLAQTGGRAWCILDAAMAKDLLIVDHYVEPGSETRETAADRFLRYSPEIARGETLLDLLEKLPIDHTTALATIEGWNARVRAGADRDDLTGRPLQGLRPLETPTFYALPFFPASRKCLGGVKADRNCMAVDRHGQAVSGLFAAGELAGLAGGHLAGTVPLEGMMVGGSLFSGRVAGRAAADFCRQ